MSWTLPDGVFHEYSLPVGVCSRVCTGGMRGVLDKPGMTAEIPEFPGMSGNAGPYTGYPFLIQNCYSFLERCIFKTQVMEQGVDT